MVKLHHIDVYNDNLKRVRESVREKDVSEMKKLLSILSIIILMILSPSALQRVSAEAGTSLDDQSWSYVLYNNNNGMPFSEANTLQQTSDGLIYVGSYGGLLRYDGEDFYRFEDARLINVISLYVDSRDRLWIGTNSNGFGIMENGDFTFYDEKDGLGSINIRCFQEDEEGNVLIGTRNGLYYMTPDGELLQNTDPQLEGVAVGMMFSDQQGTIYGLSQSSEIFTMEHGEVTSWTAGSELTTDIVSTIYPDPVNKGYLYIGLGDGGILYGSLESGNGHLQRIETPGLSMINSILISHGRLWIASDKGIGFYDKDNEFIRPDKMQRSNASQFLMEDLEGNIWAASYRLGIIKMSPSIFSNVNSLAEIPPLVVNSTYIKDGILYIGGDTGLICLDKEYKKVETPVSEMLSSERIRCIEEDADGNLWFCTFGDNGLVCLGEDGTVTNYNKDNGFASNYVRDIYEMSDGTLAVSVRGGIYYLRDKKIAESFTEDQLPNPEALCMYEDMPGRLVIGTNGSGVHYIENGEVHMMPGTRELSSTPILRIRNKPGRDELWILSATALYTLSGEELTEVPDIPNLHNYDIVFDQNDNAWILAADGIYIGNADDILAGKTIRYIHYDYKSGLPFVVTPHCRNYLSDDGMLYMSGNDGVVRININEDAKGNSDVQLIVPYIETDNEIIYLTPGEKVVLPSKTRRLWVHPFALTYSLTEPVLSYRLEGFDEKEKIANRSELPSFIYTNLKGGDYTFRFAVIDPATGEKTKEIAIPIEKKKAFHEQALFWILIAAAGAALIGFCVRLYLGKKTRELEEKHERNRILTELSLARDIQASVLPRVFPDRKEIDLYASMDPAQEVGGDFYDYFQIDKDHLALVIADVSGKGVGAALFMMVAKNAIKSTAMSGGFSGPGEILWDVNSKMCEDNDASLFVTVWLGILTLSTGRLVTANAGHEYPVLFRKNSGFTLVKDNKHGPALGILDGAVYRETEWNLEKGDGIFVYTDGVPEATDAHEEMFGNQRMVAALNKYMNRNSEGLLRGVRSEVDQFVGDAPQFDDLTMLAVRYYGKET